MWHADQAVSVVMPVRNAMPFLDEAIASILAQSHGQFEFVIGDDGSTDGSAERLDEWARRDSRIRLIRNGGEGLGPSGSANWVVREAAFPLIARMDADDVSMPDRLKRQIHVLRDNPDAVMVGSLFDRIDVEGNRLSGRDRSALGNPRCVFPVAHGSIMVRRDAFERIGGYRQQCDYWEDLDLFIRLSREGPVLILPEIYYRYRYSPTSFRQVSDEARVARALDLCVRCLAADRVGRDYEGLIDESRSGRPIAALAPSAFAHIALERLWRGDPRTILRSWAWRRTRLGLDRRDILIGIFAFWARLSPASLRGFLVAKTRFADWRARNLIRDGNVHVWRNASSTPGTGGRSRGSLGRAGSQHNDRSDPAPMLEGLTTAGAAAQRQG